MKQVCSCWKIVMMAVLLSFLPVTAGAKEADRRTFAHAVSAGNELPRVFCLNPTKLAESKARLARGDDAIGLLESADAWTVEDQDAMRQ